MYLGAALVLWILIAGYAARALSRGYQRHRYGSINEKLANRWRRLVQSALIVSLVAWALRIAAPEMQRCSPHHSETWLACARGAPLSETPPGLGE
jgi:hypothetical protein